MFVFDYLGNRMICRYLRRRWQAGRFIHDIPFIVTTKKIVSSFIVSNMRKVWNLFIDVRMWSWFWVFRIDLYIMSEYRRSFSFFGSLILCHHGYCSVSESHLQLVSGMILSVLARCICSALWRRPLTSLDIMSAREGSISWTESIIHSNRERNKTTHHYYYKETPN